MGTAEKFFEEPPCPAARFWLRRVPARL